MLLADGLGGLMLKKTKDAQGRWRYSFGDLPVTTGPAPADNPVEALDLDNIVKTVSAMKKWLKTSPSKKDVQFVIEYETANANRTSAVGESGCLTLYLEGE